MGRGMKASGIGVRAYRLSLPFGFQRPGFDVLKNQTR